MSVFDFILNNYIYVTLPQIVNPDLMTVLLQLISKHNESIKYNTLLVIANIYYTLLLSVYTCSWVSSLFNSVAAGNIPTGTI